MCSTILEVTYINLNKLSKRFFFFFLYFMLLMLLWLHVALIKSYCVVVIVVPNANFKQEKLNRLSI